MAHRSRLAGFIIDCSDSALRESADFWSQALGLQVTDYDESGLGLYAPLGDGPGGLHIEVQKVAHPSRVHLDIETDDSKPRFHDSKRWAPAASSSCAGAGG